MIEKEKQEKLLEIDNLNVSFKTYAGEVSAVRGVSFDVRKGEVVGVVGESGCGKSVTSSAIMRILPTPPAVYNGGSISFEGRDLLKLPEKEMQMVRGKEISMIFQDPSTSLNPTMKIGVQISEGLIKHQNMPKADAMARAVEMLELVGVSNPAKRVKQYPHELSGGMRQRVMIAIALACRPKLLIADEPTTALDVTIQAQILKLMLDLKSTFNTSIILITHDLGVVAQTCDRVIVMYAGQAVETGSAKAIFKNARHPYTKGLLESVPSMKMSREKALVPIVGSPPDLYSPPEGCAFYARCKYAMKICLKNNSELLQIEPHSTDEGEAHFSACWLSHSDCSATPFWQTEEGKHDK